MLGWYFACKNLRLRYGDGRLIREGHAHKVSRGGLMLCHHGLHASRNILDAIDYAPGIMLCRVELGGKIKHGEDKSCASERTYLGVIDARKILAAFARRCALDVIGKWRAPQVVREYLETGNPKLRKSAKQLAHMAMVEMHQLTPAFRAAGVAMKASTNPTGDWNKLSMWRAAIYTAFDLQAKESPEQRSRLRAQYAARLSQMALKAMQIKKKAAKKTATKPKPKHRAKR